MKQLENTLIDNSFEDRMIHKLDNRKILSFKNIVNLYKKDTIKNLYNKHSDKNFINVMIKKFDRNISIFIDYIIYNLKYSELSRKYNLTSSCVKQICFRTQFKLSLYKEVFKRRVDNNNI